MEVNNKLHTLNGDRIYLNFNSKILGNKDEILFYFYNIYLNNTDTQIGKINISIDHNYDSYYHGNVGYEINEEYRGSNYALEAVRLIINVAKHHRMSYLILTCVETNIASYKSIEKLGSKLIEIVLPPKEFIFYYDGIKPHRIYRLEI